MATAVASSLLMVLGAVGLQRAHGPDAIEDAPVERQLSMQEVAAPTLREVVEHEPTADSEEAERLAMTSTEPANEMTSEATSEAPKRGKGVKSSKSSKKTKNSKSSKSFKISKSSKTSKTSKSKTSKTDRSIPVECVLNPASCTKTGQPRTSPGHSAEKATETRPSKLSSAQLKKALASTKASARSCGPEHGTASGTRVAVKLSIEGRTGKVVSATAQGDHAGSSLGRCVAGALSRTQFPAFSSPRMGMVYSVRM
ncbi:MAG: hypothetical protein AAF799_39430 [Myxococcota bacterium]